MDEVVCGRCGNECVVEGDFPKLHAWCDSCGDYAKVDMYEYTRDVAGDLIDEAEYSLDDR